MVRRVILGLVAAVVLVAGLAAGAAAVWAFTVFGAAGVLRFDAGTIVPGTDAAATIIDVDRFEATVPYIGALGDAALSVTTGEQGDPSDTLFMGAGPTPRVDEYLKGVPYSVASREGATWQVRDVPGVVAPAPPGDEEWWLARDVGRRPSVAVPPERPLTLVLMHPSGVASGDLTLSVDFTVPTLATYLLWLWVTCGILLITGAVLLALALRRPGRGRHAAPKPVRGRHAAGSRKETADEQSTP